jgi:hypothetical protein
MYRKILATLLCGLMIFLVGCGGKKTSGESSQVSTNSEPEVIYYTNNLTGEKNMTDKDKENDRPVAVMINNISIAQKVQTGLTEADIIYETEVEGGITRLMAVFKDISKVEKIGTVRSARYPYIDLAMGHGAIYVHHGQDKTYAKPHLRDTQTLAVGENNAGVRIRNEGLAVEHTLYGYGDKIWNWFVKKDYDTELKSVENWQNFADKDKKVEFTDLADTVTVKFSNAYTSVFKYDDKSGKYVRFFRDTERKDYYTGKSELFKNVFVLETSITYYPDGKHKKVDLTAGSGYYCVNGTYTPIKWKKGSSSNGLKFYTADGTPLEVSQGNSWVCFHSKSFDPKFEANQKPEEKTEIKTDAVSSAKN